MTQTQTPQTETAPTTQPGTPVRRVADAPGITVTVDPITRRRVYRGRTLEELLPQIQTDLGDDAVVLRRREGLSGGVGGFFQQRFVEVEAMAGADFGVDAYDDEPARPGDDVADAPAATPVAAASAETTAPQAAAAPSVAAEPQAPAAAEDAGEDAATEDLDGATFLASLDAARRRVRARTMADLLDEEAAAAAPAPVPAADDDPLAAWLASAAAPASAGPAASAAPTAAPVPAPPAPTPAAPASSATPAAAPAAAPRPAAAAPSGSAPARPTAPAPRRAPEAAPGHAVDADVLEYGLVARGLPAALARGVVAEGVAHGLALDPGHRLDRAVRAALARRLPRTGDRSGASVLALVGTAGVGRTTAAAALVRAHAAAGRTVLAVALGTEQEGAALVAALAGDGVVPLVTADGADVAAARAATTPDLCVIDAAPLDPGDADGVRRLRAALDAAGVDEVHVVLPATASARSCTKTLARTAPLSPTGVVMTHRDASERPGTVLGAAVAHDVPVAYVATASGIALADPARLARLVQP